MGLWANLGTDEYSISPLVEIMNIFISHLAINDFRPEKSHNRESCLTLRSQIFYSESFIFQDHQKYAFENAALEFSRLFL